MPLMTDPSPLLALLGWLFTALLLLLVVACVAAAVLRTSRPAPRRD